MEPLTIGLIGLAAVIFMIAAGMRIAFATAFVFAATTVEVLKLIKAIMDAKKANAQFLDSEKAVLDMNKKLAAQSMSIEGLRRRRENMNNKELAFLAKARIIAQLHGWSIWAESRGKGHGASIKIKIPDYEVLKKRVVLERKIVQ